MILNKPNLRIHMKGRREDGGRADAAAYGAFVKDVVTCLYSLSVIVSGKKNTYLIQGSKSSGANCLIVSRDDALSERIATDTYSLFQETITALESNDRFDQRIGLYEMKQFEKLVKPFKSGASSIRIGSTKITSRFGETVKGIMGGTDRSVGQCKGVIRAMQTYGKNMFRMFPAIEGNSIVCRFHDSLKKQVLDNYEKNVMVYGVKLTLPGSIYPSMIEVKSIDSIPCDDELPSLYDLHGIMSGGFVDKTFRDEFDEAFSNG